MLKIKAQACQVATMVILTDGPHLTPGPRELDKDEEKNVWQLDLVILAQINAHHYAEEVV